MDLSDTSSGTPVKDLDRERANKLPWKKAVVCLVFCIIGISLVDVLVYVYSDKSLAVDSATLDLSGEFDATLSVSGSARFQSNMHSYSVSGGRCRLLYADSAAVELQRIADIFVVMETEMSQRGEFHLNMQLQRSEYPQLRSFLWAASSGRTEAARAALSCDVDLVLNVYTSFPLSHTYSFEQDIDLTMSSSKNSGSSLQSAFDDMMNIKLPSSSIDASEILFPVSLPVGIVLPFTANSFTVNIPEMVYELTSTGNEKQADLFISSSRSELELTSSAPCLNTIVSIGCRRRGGADCSLAEGIHLDDWVSDVRNGEIKFNADTEPSKSSFLTKLLGENHFVRGRKYQGHINSGGHRALTDLISPRDPDVSNGAECVVFDADSAYESFVCYVVEKGFHVFYVDIADESGYLGYFKGVTSWSVDGGFAFTSNMEAAYDGGYLLTMNVSSSCDYQNASVVFNYYEGSTTRIHTNVFSWWQFANGGEIGDVRYIMQLEESISSSLHGLVSDGVLTYGNHSYAVYTTLNETNPDLEPEYAVAVGHGTYGGVASSWWMTLDDGAVSKDSTLLGVSDAMLSWYVSESGDESTFRVYFFLGDAEDVEQVFVDSLAFWDSSQTWYSSGNVDASSVIRVASDMFSGQSDDDIRYDVDRDFALDFSYDDGEYNFLTTLKKSKSVDLTRAVEAVGQYSGDFLDWRLTLDESFLYWDEEKVGTAIGLITVLFKNSGKTVIFLQGFDAGDEEILKVDSEVIWVTQSSWESAGSVQESTLIQITDFFRQHDLNLNYSDGEYQFHSVLIDKNSLEYNEAVADGGYGGSQANWYVTLTDSYLYWDQAVVGSAMGTLSGKLQTSGDVSLSMQAFDDSDAVSCTVDSLIEWSSSSDWLEDGDIDVSMTIESGDFYRVQQLELTYGNGEYTFSSLLEGEFATVYNAVNASGVYGGSQANWYVTLTDSYLYWDQAVVGSAMGTLSGKLQTSGDVSLSMQAFEGSDAVACAVDSLIEWSSSDSWESSGSITTATSVHSGSFNRIHELLFQYGSNKFSGESALIDTDGVIYQEIAGDGRYGGDFYDWWTALDNGHIIFQKDYIGSASGKISLFVDNSGRVGEMFLSTLTKAGMSNDVYFDTTNKLQWEGSASRAFGLVHSDTSISGNSKFLLKSYVDVDLTEEVADFLYASVENGEERLNCTATAWYDVATGFMTGIAVTASYDKGLIFETSIYSNTMTETLDMSPTVSPTSKPSQSPTVVPTSKSARPTVIPPGRPSFMPTQAPTAVKVSGTYIEFTAEIIMDGVVYADFINDEVAMSAAVLTTRDALNPDMALNEITLSSTDPARRNLRLHFVGARIRQLEDGTTAATYAIDTNVDNLGYLDASTAYSSLVANLDESVASGRYTVDLVANADAAGSTSLSNAVVTEVPVVSDYTVTEFSGSGSDGGNDNDDVDIGVIIGVTIACAVILFGMTFAVWWFLFRTADSAETMLVKEKEMSADNGL